MFGYHRNRSEAFIVLSVLEPRFELKERLANLRAHFNHTADRLKQDVSSKIRVIESKIETRLQEHIEQSAYGRDSQGRKFCKLIAMIYRKNTYRIYVHASSWTKRDRLASVIETIIEPNGR